jgi:hypothetical protein
MARLGQGILEHTYGILHHIPLLTCIYYVDSTDRIVLKKLNIKGKNKH